MTVAVPPKPAETPELLAAGIAAPAAATDLKVRSVDWRPKLLPVEDRHSILDTLMVAPSGGALWRFAALMFLSSMVASIGLLQNSAAVVIGAMMIAPLMAPIMGMAACLIMGWVHRLFRGLALVSLSAAGAVAVGWVTATLLPATGTGLPAEVVARSSPDIRDLLVAMGAGAVGALATVHKKVSAALPGVAVAVAIVPPLASAGVLLGRGQPELARGAAILFATNLVGIVLMAAVVFLLSDLVPRDTFHTHRRQILASLAMAAVSAGAVAMILTPRFIALTGHARDLEIATQTLTSMLSPGSVLSHITASGSTVRADITSPTSPPPVQTVAASLSRALGTPGHRGVELDSGAGSGAQSTGNSSATTERAGTSDKGLAGCAIVGIARSRLRVGDAGGLYCRAVSAEEGRRPDVADQLAVQLSHTGQPGLDPHSRF